MGTGPGATLPLVAWGTLHSTPRGAGGPCTPNASQVMGLSCALPCPGPAKVPTSCPAPPGLRLDRHKGGVLSVPTPVRPQGMHHSGPPPPRPGRTPLLTSQATAPGITRPGYSRPTQATPPTQPPRSQATLLSVKAPCSSWALTHLHQQAPRPRRSQAPGIPREPPIPRAAPKRPGLWSMGVEASAQG